MPDAALGLKEDLESEKWIKVYCKIAKSVCEDMQDLILVLQYRDDSQLWKNIRKERSPFNSFRFMLQIDTGLLKIIQFWNYS